MMGYTDTEHCWVDGRGILERHAASARTSRTESFAAHAATDCSCQSLLHRRGGGGGLARGRWRLGDFRFIVSRGTSRVRMRTLAYSVIDLLAILRYRLRSVAFRLLQP